VVYREINRERGMAELTIENLLGTATRPRDLARSPLAWVPLIRNRLPASTVRKVTDATGLSQADLLAALGMACRTIARRRKSDALLSQEESEKLVRFARVAARAAQVLGDGDAALDWLRTPNRALERQRPLDLLDTEIGAASVLDTLGRIEHGVFA
jgi:putative toxin-antitoxin system antitoxin component (TIGR02293 family)